MNSGSNKQYVIADDREPVTLSASACAINCEYLFTSPFENGAHSWKIRMELGGVWTAYTAPTDFTVLKFSLLSPSGTITNRSPLYTWEEIPGATSYRYELYNGTTLVLYKVVAPTVCVDGICQHNAGTTLKLAGYSWRLRAKINGVWTIYSDKIPFTVTTP